MNCNPRDKYLVYLAIPVLWNPMVLHFHLIECSYAHHVIWIILFTTKQKAYLLQASI